jgi:predicted acetyltransferase
VEKVERQKTPPTIFIRKIMAINLRWVGDDEQTRVVQTRLRCYGDSEKDRQRFLDIIRNDIRCKSGDYLLAEESGQPVGTATSISFKMWVRGACFPCQGVAWVGAIKTMRRRKEKSSSGIASIVMWEIVRKARERGDTISALMPFRASFYEHFGFGLVEQRNEWILPLAILPTGDFDGIRFYEPEDFSARAQCLRRVNQLGQCAIERSEEYWRSPRVNAEDNSQIVDRPDDKGPVRSSMFFSTEQVKGKNILRVAETFYEDLPALKRQLHFLSTLKDQYFAAHIQLPRDVPLNWLVKEPQMTDVPGNHPTAQLRPSSRMMVRVLDHKAFLEALHLPTDIKGAATVAVRESEGHQSRFRVQIESGRASVKPSEATPDFECSNRVWSAVACGEITASNAARWGLASAGERATVLNSLANGPAVFCHEPF